jgi:hypothetical protein
MDVEDFILCSVVTVGLYSSLADLKPRSLDFKYVYSYSNPQ